MKHLKLKRKSQLFLKIFDYLTYTLAYTPVSNELESIIHAFYLTCLAIYFIREYFINKSELHVLFPYIIKNNFCFDLFILCEYDFDRLKIDFDHHPFLGAVIRTFDKNFGFGSTVPVRGLHINKNVIRIE